MRSFYQSIRDRKKKHDVSPINHHKSTHETTQQQQRQQQQQQQPPIRHGFTPCKVAPLQTKRTSPIPIITKNGRSRTDSGIMDWHLPSPSNFHL